jgi:hypothetical protein
MRGLALAWWAATLPATPAQALEVSASVDRQQVEVGQPVSLQVRVRGATGQLSEPQLPALEHWTVSLAERSHELSIINGSFSSAFTFMYVLVPHAEGKATIGPISVEHDRQIHRTAPIEVEVRAAASRLAAPADETRPPPQPPPARQREQPRELFVEAYVDKLQARVQEPIVLTVAFYQAVPLLEEPRYTPPQTPGFLTREMTPAQRSYAAVIQGVRYQVTELRSVLIPTKPGRHKIGPARLEAVLPPGGQGEGYSLFTRDRRGPIRRVLVTEPILIDVAHSRLRGT